jgi:IS5 family transposase
MRNWSYAVLERKMPDAKTMGRWGVALGPAVIKQIHEPMVEIAREGGVVPGRRMRVDTTVVETNIHYRVRVLTRTMQRITKIAGPVGAKLRDRSRSVKFRLLEIARAARGKVPNRAKMAQAYGRLLDTTARVVGQARRFAGERAPRARARRSSSCACA